MDRRIAVTGLGMIGDFGVGKEDFCNFIDGREEKQIITDFNFDDYIDTALLRRADQTSYFASIAAKFALEDAKLLTDMKCQDRYKFGAILGTVHGALEYTIEYHKALVLDNSATVSPSLFSNSVINAAVSCISNIFKVCGYTITIPGYAGVYQAIKLSAELIKEGKLDICLVGGVDVNNEFLVEAYSSCMEDSKLISDYFGGSGFLVLESFESAVKRGVRIYAEILKSEITSASYKKMLKYNISPIEGFNLEDLGCVFTAAFNDKDSRKREALFLERINNGKISISSCTDLFGCTFCAAEAFQIIMGIIKTHNLYDKVLINYSSQTASNAYLLLRKA